MSDIYGFAKVRAELAAQMGVSTAYVEQIYTDDWIHEVRRKGEDEGEDITLESISDGLICCYCTRPVHQTENEMREICALMNCIYTRRGTYLHIRFGVTAQQVRDVEAAIDQWGQISRDRCANPALRPITACTGEVQ